MRNVVNIFESPGMNKTEKEILLLILEEQKEQTKILRTIASNTEQKCSGPGGKHPPDRNNSKSLLEEANRGYINNLKRPFDQ